MSITRHTTRLVVHDGVGWIVRGDGDLWSATPGEMAEAIVQLRHHIGSTLAWLKERMPCAAGKCCEDLRARIADLQALLPDEQQDVKP